MVKVGMIVASLLLFFNFCESKSFSSEIGKIKIVKSAITDIVNDLCEKYSMRFDLVIIENNIFLQSLANEILRNFNCTFSVKLYGNDFLVKNKFYKIQSLDYQQIILSDKLFHLEVETLNNFTTYKKPYVLVYNHNSKANSLGQSSYHPRNHIVFDLFEAETKKFKLLLCNKRRYSSCSDGTPNFLYKSYNEFSIESMKWKSNEFVDDIKNYKQCEIQVKYQFRWGPPFYFYNSTRHIMGLYVDILNEFALQHNMFATHKYYRSAEINNIDALYNYIDILIQDFIISNPIEFQEFVKFYNPTSPLYYSTSKFFVTRGLPYSSFERLILPFDSPTWLLIIITFLITFFTIFIVYKFPKTVQNLVFGANINHPSLSATQIFFGIGLVKMPGKSFARILFMIFTLYCLIIRNAYQGKMFEFLYADIRHPTASTISEIINLKIPILVQENLLPNFNQSIFKE